MADAPHPSNETPRFLRALRGEKIWPPPVWLMRQAGRYLPEYREVRKQAGSFLDLCYNPDLAVEVTLQPIRRYGFDAAILFADILLVPHALGQGVSFREGEGPVLEPPVTAETFASLSLDGLHQHLDPVYQTVRGLRAALPQATALIGFAGAPWTVATYMLAGGGTRAPADLRLIGYQSPGFVTDLIDLLTEATAAYLLKQIEAGAQAIQIFDTWAGGLPEPLFDRLCVDPVRRISEAIKSASPHTPIIAFPRGAGSLYGRVAGLDTVDAVSLDVGVDLKWARDVIEPHAVLQGNLDPLALLAETPIFEAEIERVLTAMREARFVFNLGHGIVPQTSPDRVAELVERIRAS
ncbi:MAG: uroporphyrinogen decarboxylase [Pseudomonadota bacterium]